jgi:hypothetical protein
VLSRWRGFRGAARLRRLTVWMVAMALGHEVWAQGDGDEVRRPERLTAGISDQLLGQLAPDGRLLYFISNRNTVSEIYTQELSGRAHLLFDEGADLTWPRVSPDGRRILYISFQEDARGQLCVRDLPDKRRRCLESGGALQAQWISNDRIALLCRSTVAGDLRVFEVQVSGHLRSRKLFDRNLSSPTVSPDGKWLIYVPVARYVPEVGPGFAGRAASRFEAVRLDRGSGSQPLEVDLPGLSGQPAFSVDGRNLYFTQFFNDTNGDGEIDAGDHGVLFRLPFKPDQDNAPLRSAAALPLQLTDASWNCQYPSPTAATLVATCSRRGHLDIYRMPLDGQVPEDWSSERLKFEIDFSSQRTDELLLYRRLLQRETSITARRAVMINLLRHHLAADEFASAAFYAEKVKAIHDPQTAGLGTALAILIEHRRAVRERERGRINLDFQTESRRRFTALLTDAAQSPQALALRRVVRSEIAEALGDYESARRELESVAIAEVKLSPIFELFYDRADALYRELDDREALVAIGRQLAEHPALTSTEQLRYARAGVRALLRGRSYDEQEILLARERARSAPSSEWAFALELGAAVLQIRTEEPPKAIRDRFVDLYKSQDRPERRRAVVMDGAQRASEFEAERVVEKLAQLYVADAPLGTKERQRAARLFERVMIGRAERRLGKGRIELARDAFSQVVKTTGSLEALVGLIETRLTEGARTSDLENELLQLSSDPARRAFWRAYLITQDLPTLGGAARHQAIERALAELNRAARLLKGEGPVQALFGVVLHESYLEEGSLPAAQRANVHYLMALELSARSPRYRALILDQLALLQTDVGNYRIALGYVEEREKLPFHDDLRTVAHMLTKARTLFHIDREKEAAETADRALQLIKRVPALDSFCTIALDRAALYHLGANEYEQSLALYDQAIPLLGARQGKEVQRNVTVARLARAAAALGVKLPERALTDLEAVDQALKNPTIGTALKWPHTRTDEVLRSYRLIASGLKANAHIALGNLQAASQALELRRGLADERLRRSDLEEHLRALALVEARLGEVARQRGDGSASADWFKSAISHAEDYRRRTGVHLYGDELTLLRLISELRLQTSAPLHLKLPQRLKGAEERLLGERDPAFRVEQRWIEIYLSLISRKRSDAGVTSPPTKN